jgi:hypothetical protein
LSEAVAVRFPRIPLFQPVSTPSSTACQLVR